VIAALLTLTPNARRLSPPLIALRGRHISGRLTARESLSLSTRHLNA